MMKRTLSPHLALTLLASACLLYTASLSAREGFFLYDDVEYEPPVASTPDGKTKFEVFGDTAVTEGDIIIGSARNLITGIDTRGLGRTSKLERWIDGIVYYEFDGTMPQADQNRVLEAIAHWNNNTSVTLLERTPAIASSVPDYVYFEPYPACASWVGRIGGPQELNVGSQCSTGSLIHEIGHAVGLFHEHTRADRDNFITVAWDNIKTGKEFNFEIVSSGVTALKDYDYGSVMHYGTAFFSRNGQPTIQPPDGVTIGQREGLSVIDRASVDELYATDLSLLSQDIGDESTNSVSITATVNNAGAMGAHDIEFLMPLNPGQTLVESAHNDWTCTASSDHVSCRLWRLASGAQSELTLQISGTANRSDIGEGYLRSKTFDLDTHNNGTVFTPPGEDVEEPIPDTEPDVPGEESEPVEQITPDASPAIESPASNTEAAASLDWWLGLGFALAGVNRIRRMTANHRK